MGRTCAVIVWSTTQEIFVLNVDLIISVTQEVGKPDPARDPRGGRFHRGGGLDAAAPLSVRCSPVPQACSLLLGGYPGSQLVVVSAWTPSVYLEKSHGKMCWHLPSSP